ncbi:MAG: TetR/AcrR family transcriptional regulator [Chloroflexota bacterium]|jgi:AcrR family transcriptional regulator|nr:TetR/AcrR family transcriptional regulator [Chloroflexota bacterium]
MSEKTTDRRILRTCHALQKALIQLILEEGYDAVTIEEITERANLGRTTFYLHFRDKEDLFMHAIDTICEEFIEKHKTMLNLVDSPKSSIKKLPLDLDEHILYHIFNHARDNADLYKVMLRGEGSAKASKRFSSIIVDETVKRLKNVDNLEINVPIKIFAVFFSGTLIELVTWWLEDDQPYSIEDMVKYYRQLFINGALNTLNLTEINEI